MTKTRQLASRISRLRALVGITGDGQSIASHLTAIDDLRDFRNGVVHGAFAWTDEGEGVALVSWKNTVGVSAEMIENATKKLGRANLALAAAYKAQFGEDMRLDKAAQAAPPPEA